MPNLEHRFELDFPVEEVFAWHARPGALGRLTPPWESVRVLRAPEGLEVGARAVLEIRRGPIALTWEVEHIAYEEGRRFVDRQLHGPFAHWTHEHRFEPLPGGRTLVEDRVEWGAPLGALGDAFSEGFIASSLRRLFAFRARRLSGDLAAHRRYGAGEGRIVAITGGSGFIGRALSQLLTSGGYRVLHLSRSPGPGTDGVRWDPLAGELSGDRLEGVYGIVHLAGEPISGLRWTEAKREAILRSREEGTRLLAGTVAELKRPPEVFVSASAVGYYGNRGEERLTEASESGGGFLADVCRRWERATHAARAAGVRTIHLRTGFVLSPAGGGLAALLTPFRAGVGGRIGSGRQYMSWIDLDDETDLILHALRTPEVRGPMNATAPAPIPNAAFTDLLGRVLRRPTLLPLPSLAVRAAMGQMGEELLLFGQRAFPDHALATGYTFRTTEAEGSLRHQLGRLEGELEGEGGGDP